MIQSNQKVDYREYKAIHYSLLSSLSTNPKSINEEKNFSDGITFGDCLDILLTQSIEKFYEKYVVSLVKKPTGQIGEFIDLLVLYSKNSDSFIFEIDDITDTISIDLTYFDIIYNQVGFKRDSKEVVLNKLKNEINYLKFLIQSKNKIVIDREFYVNVVKAAETLKTHEFTKNYFESNNPNVKILFQKDLYFNIDEFDVEGKCLIDILIIDEDKKIIIPIDIKSTSDSVYSFPINFIKWKYYLQASFYTYGLSKCYQDYTIDDFKFLVISSTNVYQPLIYKCSIEDLLVGKYGGLNKFTNRKVKGFFELIKDYLWHKDKDLWDYPREVYENQGEIVLDVLKYEFDKE